MMPTTAKSTDVLNALAARFGQPTSSFVDDILPNPWGGFDVQLDDGGVLRVSDEDPDDDGVAVTVLSGSGVILSEARFGGVASDAIAEFIYFRL